MVCKSVIDPVGHAVAPRGHPQGAGQGSSLYHQPTETIMHMQDWNTYRQQLIAGVGDLGKLSPDTVRGYAALGGAGAKTNHLEAKTRELIALAVAISLRCDGCITVHTEAARKLGATREEIAEALGVAISVNAGAALVYSTRTLDAFAAAQEG
jgi:AhpD family alkylhydroperoxidase